MTSSLSLRYEMRRLANMAECEEYVARRGPEIAAQLAAERRAAAAAAETAGDAAATASDSGEILRHPWAHTVPPLSAIAACHRGGAVLAMARASRLVCTTYA